MAEPTLRPLRVGEVLDVCINIFTRNFLTFVRIVLVLVIPVQILSVVVLVATVNDPDLLPRFGGATSGDGTISNDDFWAYFGGQVVVVVLSVVLTAIATAACFKAVSDAYLGTKPDWRSSISFA